MPALPDPFVVAASSDATTLIVDARHADAFVRAGLDRLDGWQTRLAATGQGTGRGATARVELADGTVARLKQLRRGGLVGPLWRNRFLGRRRALENLSLPLEAARRGVSTPAPLALLLDAGRAGLSRAWLAVEELAGAVDLAARFSSDDPPGPSEIAAAMRAVRRMHDAGVEHRDLNLGNLMIGRGPDPRAHVIDMDRARLHPGPLPFRLRQEALRRMERSHLKSGFPAPAAEAYYRHYAGEDDALARRLARGRRAGRLRILVHRLGWRR